VSLVKNEQIKLTATALNNVGVAFVVVGLVSPLVGFSQLRQAPSDALAFLFHAAWFASGLALHVTARLVLRRLKP